MDSNLLITVLSITVTIISVFIAVYQIYLTRKPFKVITRGRQYSLEGLWKGKYTQDNKTGGNKLEGEMRLSLSPGRKKVIGIVTITSYYYKKDYEFIVDGGFKADRFLFLNYWNKNDSVTQFGNIILELTSNAEILKGRFIGYGPESEKIVTAQIVFNKTIKNK
ncbi:MAG: hypothetical protein KKA84_16250 [Bacteroidetes bacterium]|nr:hypothetical protein [Bacteroidota bacterium]